MSKRVVNNKCPHCGSSEVFFKKTIYRVKQEYSFDEPLLASGAHYQEVSGGVQAWCLNCEKKIAVENSEG